MEVVPYSEHMEVTLSGLALPLRILPPVPMTDEEIMQFSARNEGLPIERDEEGYLIIMSPTGNDGSAQNVEIVVELELWNRQTSSGRVTDSNGGYALPDGSVRAPDAAWTSNEKMATLSPAEKKRFAPVCPDFVIELRSASDSLPQLQRKMEMWLRNGVQLAWLVDPIEKAVSVYRPGREPEYLDNISQVAGESPVAGFVLPLHRIFT